LRNAKEMDTPHHRQRALPRLVLDGSSSHDQTESCQPK
jgi:hypothetical protein